MDLRALQQAVRAAGVDGWLLCDFRNRDPLAYRVLGLDFQKMNTRRWFYYIPARGTPKKVVGTLVAAADALGASVLGVDRRSGAEGQRAPSALVAPYDSDAGASRDDSARESRARPRDQFSPVCDGPWH